MTEGEEETYVEAERLGEAEPMPEGCFARIEVYDHGVRVNLAEGMPSGDFADMLTAIAEAFREGPIRRVE